MTTYQELKSQAEDLMRQAEAARKAEIGTVLAEIKAKMAMYGITLADLGGNARVLRGRRSGAGKGGKRAQTVKTGKQKAKPTKARKPVAAKYRNRATGESWSGRGKLPKWLAELEAAGRKREEFLAA